MSTPVVLITGALTGIGRATAIAFAKEGVRLVISGCNEAKGKVLEAILRSFGTEAEFVRGCSAREGRQQSGRDGGRALRSA